MIQALNHGLLFKGGVFGNSNQNAFASCIRGITRRLTDLVHVLQDSVLFVSQSEWQRRKVGGWSAWRVDMVLRCTASNRVRNVFRGGGGEHNGNKCPINPCTCIRTCDLPRCDTEEGVMQLPRWMDYSRRVSNVIT